MTIRDRVWSSLAQILIFIQTCALCWMAWIAPAMRGNQAASITPQSASIYIHGMALADADHAPLAGFIARLVVDGRQVAYTATNQSGKWGTSYRVISGAYMLLFEPPPGWRVVQALRAPNVTDFQLSADLTRCTFRVSPAGGQTGDFYVFCAPLAPAETPSATPRPTATLTWTPIPPTPTPTWTPGPTPTPCFRDPPPALVAEVVQRMSAAFPPPEHPLTRFGFTYGLGWPMMEQSIAIDGTGYYGQLWTPFAVLIWWPDGCISVIDSAALQHGEWRR